MFEIICTAFMGIACKVHHAMMLRTPESRSYIERQ